MKNNYNFKPFDMVLVRDYDHETWKTNLFKSKKNMWQRCSILLYFSCMESVYSL